MNSTINSYDKWSILVNCSSFATETWNSISSTKVNAGMVNTPENLASSIKSKVSSSYITNRSRPSKSKNDFYYHNSSGVTKCSHPTGGGGSSLSRINSLTNSIHEENYVNSSIYFDFENN